MRDILLPGAESCRARCFRCRTTPGLLPWPLQRAIRYTQRTFFTHPATDRAYVRVRVGGGAVGELLCSPYMMLRAQEFDVPVSKASLVKSIELGVSCDTEGSVASLRECGLCKVSRTPCAAQRPQRVTLRSPLPPMANACSPSRSQCDLPHQRWPEPTSPPWPFNRGYTELYRVLAPGVIVGRAYCLNAEPGEVPVLAGHLLLVERKSTCVEDACCEAGWEQQLALDPWM